MAAYHLFCLLVVLHSTGDSQRGAEAKKLIIGGQDAVKGRWPWMVHVNITHNKTSNWRCGGTILNEEWVMTAARCLYKNLDVNLGNSFVVVGAYALRKKAEGYKDIKAVVLPEDDISPSADNKFDMALINLRLKMNLTALNISAIRLPSVNDFFDSSSECWITGWGQVGNGVPLPFPEVLQQLKVPLIPLDRCNKSYNYQLPSNVLCAGAVGKDFCEGDTGGPLVCNTPSGFVQAGIMSFGGSAGCGKSGQPGVYTLVSPYLGFIKGRVKLPEKGSAEA